MENTTTQYLTELKSAIRGYQGAILDMTKERFIGWAESLSLEAAKILLDQHRQNKSPAIRTAQPLYQLPRGCRPAMCR